MMVIYATTLLTCLTATLVNSSPQNQGVTAGLPGYTQLRSEQVRYLQNKGFGSTVKTFRPTTAAYEEEDEYEDAAQEQSQDRQPTYAYPTAAPKTAYYAAVTPKGYVKQEAKPQAQQQYRRAGEKIGQANNKLEEEEEEKEEPDRLTLLLPQSKFQCAGKKTGYYADEDLSCEVFHYCQDNARHSWICPEGFTFHQIQLICMPPSGDNICEKSSDYHFVNDYLYKPVNLEEYQQRPNTSLRYSDRYFPESYRPRYDEDEEDARPVHRQHSIRVTQTVPRYQPAPVQSTTFRPQAQVGQVFRSPEEINISLQQRRPVQYTTAKYVDVYEKK